MSALEKKQKELDDLKASFDEYVSSSKELEVELENSLDEAENRYTAAMKQNKLFEARINDLNSKVSASNSEKEKLHASLAQTKSKMDKASITIRNLENSTASLEDKVRELEFSNKDLSEKLEAAEEEKIVLRVNAEQSPNKASSNEKRLKAELMELQSELAKADSELIEYKERESEFANREKELVRKSSKSAYYQEELTKAQTQISLLETKLQQRIQANTDLEKEINDLRHNAAHASGAGSSDKDPRRRMSVRSAAVATKGNEVVESFEDVVEDLYERLGESDEENRELMEALEIAQEDLMKNHQAQMQAIQAAAEMEVKLKLAEDKVEDLEHQLQEKSGMHEDADKSVDILKNRLEQKVAEIKEIQKQTERSVRDAERATEKALAENEMLRQQIKAMELGNLRISTDEETETEESLQDRLTNAIDQFKKATAEWCTERAALIQDRELLLQEIDDVRAIKGLEKFEFVSALPIEEVPSKEVVKELLDSSSRARISAEEAVASEDTERMREEIFHQLQRYEQLRSSNAQLLHKLQSAKGNIQVCCRARPPNDQELGQGANICLDVIDERELSCFDKRTMTWKTFAFDRVWDEDCTQGDVFADIEPLALSVVDGFNACIFAYGQTGSGKTFTMNGYGSNYGVSYRTLHEMFELLNLRKTRCETSENRKQTAKRRNRHGRSMSSNQQISDPLSDEEQEEHDATDNEAIDNAAGTEKEESIKKGKDRKHRTSLKTNAAGHFIPEPMDDSPHNSFEFSVEVSMLEIYNESVHDLLIAPSKSLPMETPPSLDIRHDAEGNVSVPGLKRENVSDLEDVMQVFARGSANRATTSTHLNEHSSRSHSILIVYVTTVVNNGVPVTGKLYLVDLAGSERMDKSGVTGQAMKETQHINKSLSALGDVMEGLDKKAKHVPFRNSKLTYLLQDSLGGNSKTMMIVTVCPTELTADETLFALQFATRARNIQLGVAKRNVSFKSMEESLKTIRHELKEERRRSSHLQDVINDMRRQSQRTQDKISHQLDTKIRNIDETRKSAEVQIEVLTRTNSELIARLNEEKENHRLVAAECDNTQKTLRKMQEQVKTLGREKERAYVTLQTRDKENESLRQLVRSLKDPSAAAAVSTPSGVSGAVKLRNAKTPSYSTPPTVGSKPSRFLAQTSSNRKSAIPTPGSRTAGRPKTTPGTRHSIATPASHSVTCRESEDDGDAHTHEFQESGSSSLSNSADLSHVKPTTSRRTHKSADDLDSAENIGTQTSPDPGGGGFRKGTVTAMASSRAQEAMLRHQERMKKKREAMRNSSTGDRVMHF